VRSRCVVRHWLCLDAPVLTESIVTPFAVRGSDVTLQCKGRGNPPVTFRWFKVRMFLISILLLLLHFYLGCVKKHATTSHCSYKCAENL